jgi:phosphate starvation-inducible PhoH-like protein
MSKQRVKKRFTSEVNIIDFQPYLPAKKKRVFIQARNANQKVYLSKLQDESKSIILAMGPAGTGKTMLAVQVGIMMYQDGLVDKIVITRPAVSVDDDLGFLPGDLNE